MYMRCSSCLGYDTLGCSTSPLLCRRWLKVLRGRNGAADVKSLYNSLEVDLLPGVGSDGTCEYPSLKHHNISIKKRIEG